MNAHHRHQDQGNTRAYVHVACSVLCMRSLTNRDDADELILEKVKVLRHLELEQQHLHSISKENKTHGDAPRIIHTHTHQINIIEKKLEECGDAIHNILVVNDILKRTLALTHTHKYMGALSFLCV